MKIFGSSGAIINFFRSLGAKMNFFRISRAEMNFSGRLGAKSKVFEVQGPNCNFLKVAADDDATDDVSNDVTADVSVLLRRTGIFPTNFPAVLNNFDRPVWRPSGGQTIPKNIFSESLKQDISNRVLGN